MPVLAPSSSFEHRPVLLEEVCRAFEGAPGEVYVDVTVGGAGHAAALLERLPRATLHAFDRDPTALAVARERLAAFPGRAFVHAASFDEVEEHLLAVGVPSVDGVLADLGVSSHQLDAPERGLSFRREGPLDMRMDPTRGETARELIERTPQQELADLLFRLGEERRSRRIARSIKLAQADARLVTTLDLRRAVVRAVGPQRTGGVDPATRTFQALRMAVNQELEQLDSLLGWLGRRLRVGGRVAIISFHSLEDRRVKQALRPAAGFSPLTRKPVVATPEEQRENPRARSAKLRVAQRVAVEEAGT